jgi:hypothetical protein
MSMETEPTAPDECPYHDCPQCGVRMTNRECLTCKRKDGTPVRVLFCAKCDGGPILVTDWQNTGRASNAPPEGEE